MSNIRPRLWEIPNKLFFFFLPFPSFGTLDIVTRGDQRKKAMHKERDPKGIKGYWTSLRHTFSVSARWIYRKRGGTTKKRNAPPPLLYMYMHSILILYIGPCWNKKKGTQQLPSHHFLALPLSFVRRRTTIVDLWIVTTLDSLAHDLYIELYKGKNGYSASYCHCFSRYQIGRVEPHHLTWLSITSISRAQNDDGIVYMPGAVPWHAA